MHWKEELVDSEQKVKGYLERHLRAAGIPSPYITIDPGIGFRVEAKTPKGKGILTFQLADYAGHTSMSINAFDVYAPYKKQGLNFGAMAMKCAFASLFERKKNYFVLDLVYNDGLSFWPYFGSLPQMFTLDPAHIGSFLRVYDKRLDGDAKEKIRSFIVAMHEMPLKTWQEMSQYKGRLDDERPIGHMLLREMPEYLTHRLIPGLPSVNAILQKRLGTIPPFQDVSLAFPEMAAELRGIPRNGRRYYHLIYA